MILRYRAARIHSLVIIGKYRPLRFSTMKLCLSSGAVVDHASDSYDLLDHPSAVYSGMRTISHKTKIVELDSHITRLLNSAVKQFGEDSFDADMQQSFKERFPPFLRQVALSISPSENEFRFMVILDKDKSSFNEFYVLCHSNEIKPPPAFVEVDVMELHRANPEVKSVDWVVHRQDAEKSKRR
jgi:hypothetical protein